MFTLHEEPPELTQTDTQVIEVDGVNHEALATDEITIYAGQRYSFVLNANQTVDNYWIRAKPNIGTDTTTTNGMNSAILRYHGAPVAEPTTVQFPSTTPLLEQNLRPLVHTPVVCQIFILTL